MFRNSRMYPLLFIMLMVLMPVLAETEKVREPYYLIGEVKYAVKGLTRESALAADVEITPFAERFLSLDLLEAYVVEKKKYIFNKRIFESVDYELSVLETTEQYITYKVQFNIVDAFTLLPLPYGKYDSNYGAKLGLKLWDKNLLGTLTDVYFYGGVQQLDNSFEKYYLTSNMDITNIKLFGQEIELHSAFEIKNDIEHFYDGDFYGGLSWRKIPLAGTQLNLFSSFSLEQVENGDLNDWGDGSFETGFSVGNIHVFDHILGVNYSIAVEERGVTWEKPAITQKAKISWGNILFIKHSFTAFIDYVQTYDSFTQSIDNQDVNVGLKTSYQLPFNTFYSGQIQLLTGNDNYFFESIDLRLDQKISYSKINWENNFRKGISYTVGMTNILPIDEFKPSLDTINSWDLFLEGSFLGFYPFKDIIGLGVQFKGFYATGEPQYLMPENKLEIGEYLRGILNKSISSTSFYGYAGAVLNSNVTVKVVDLEGFAEGFISPFLDIAVFDPEPVIDSGFGDLEAFYSCGFDVVVIFDKYRSYPIRGTAGFNAREAFEWAKGERELSDVEFEIILSMSLFF